MLAMPTYSTTAATRLMMRAASVFMCTSRNCGRPGRSSVSASHIANHQRTIDHRSAMPSRSCVDPEWNQSWLRM